MNKQQVTVYYDYEPGIGINATCEDWPCRNEFFRTWGELDNYLLLEYGRNYTLVEITSSNYPFLCEQGVFDAE